MEQRVMFIGVRGVDGFESTNMIIPWHRLSVAK